MRRDGLSGIPKGVDPAGAGVGGERGRCLVTDLGGVVARDRVDAPAQGLTSGAGGEPGHLGGGVGAPPGVLVAAGVEVCLDTGQSLR